jgi:nucleoside-diphosphate-sugar epimerase
MKILIAGCGWLGRAVGRALIERGEAVVGVRRTPEGRGELESIGIEPLILDLAAPDAAGSLPDDVDAVVACPAPRAAGVEAYTRAYVVALRTLLDGYRDRGLGGFIYTSSTGVFGQDDGGDVDESTTPSPTTGTARVLVVAEKQVLTAAREGSAPARVVRLSGLYGPERFGVIDLVRQGRVGLGPGDETWMNFCHREDAARTVVAALDRGRAGAIYHASDANPVRRRDLIVWIAERLGIDPPVLPAEAKAPVRADRRIHASWTRARLGIALAYPSFREGLVEGFSSPP